MEKRKRRGKVYTFIVRGIASTMSISETSSEWDCLNGYHSSSFPLFN